MFYKSANGFSFYSQHLRSFPSKGEKKTRWLQACTLPLDTKIENVCLCSKHFKAYIRRTLTKIIIFKNQ